VDYSGGAITATYSTAAAGRNITASYRYGTSGITGALSSGAEHWMAVSVNGTPQATRQKVLAVPFARIADVSNHSSTADEAAFALKANVNLSDYQGLSNDVTYQAPSSGFIVASKDNMLAFGGQECWVKVGHTPYSLGLITYGYYQTYTNPNRLGSQQTVPIKKGRYWRCTNFDRVFFVSFE